MVQEQKRMTVERNITEIYKAKCKKYFICIDKDILDIVEKQTNLKLKKRYYTDIKLVPFFKTIRSLQNLQELNLSHNLLTNKSLNQLNLSKYNINIELLNLAYNHFIYDDVFYDILLKCQNLKKLKYLNISGLSIAQDHQDNCWHQILLIPELEILKFKYSSLDHLPNFLPIKIQQSKLFEIVLKNNQINHETDQVLSDLLSFREFKRFSI